MPNYLVTGKLGAGKSKIAVSRIQHYLWEGRKVATNLDIWPEHLELGARNKEVSIVRLPDKPRVSDLEAIGRGHDGDKPDDKRNGILVLDELATWLNSRDWRDKERSGVIDWMLHARKKRWDVYLLVQDADAIDSQLRRSICDHFVSCSRLDRLKLLGFMRLPRVHLAHVYYGESASGIAVDRWAHMGAGLDQAYDTEQVFTLDQLYVDDREPVDMRAPFTYLTPWHLEGRYLPPPKPSKSLRDHFKTLLLYTVFAPAHLIYRAIVGQRRYDREMANVVYLRNKKVQSV